MFAATGNRGKGFELRATPATASPAAPLARAAAVGASLSDFNLSVTPRSFVDQGDVDCCVSCALAYAMEVVHPDWPALAPLFHNYVSRFINGSAGVTGGLALSDALTTLT